MQSNLSYYNTSTMGQNYGNLGRIDDDFGSMTSTNKQNMNFGGNNNQMGGMKNMQNIEAMNSAPFGEIEQQK